MESWTSGSDGPATSCTGTEIVVIRISRISDKNFISILVNPRGNWAVSNTSHMTLLKKSLHYNSIIIPMQCRHVNFLNQCIRSIASIIIIAATNFVSQWIHNHKVSEMCCNLYQIQSNRTCVYIFAYKVSHWFDRNKQNICCGH